MAEGTVSYLNPELSDMLKITGLSETSLRYNSYIFLFDVFHHTAFVLDSTGIFYIPVLYEES